jgi:pimeloyl-ACP methyl ester carboxylesterase
VTLDAWVEQICALIEQQSEPVVLVGHSRGGIVISGVAERMPERIARVVYLAAALVRDGQSMLEAMGGAPGVALTGQIARGPDDGTMVVADAAIRPAFYGDCSDDDVALARLLLTPEPMAASASPVHVSADRFGRVPRVYIECTRDQAIHVDAQRAMHRAYPGTRVISMDSDHSPFFSHPDELVGNLLA